MLSSITPLGERGRNNSWPRTASYYVVGSVLGGATIGLVVGGLGALVALLVDVPLLVRLTVVALVAAAGALLDTDRFRRRLPTIHRQVNEDWLDTYRPWVYGGGFGFQLGLGVITIVTTAGIYLLLAIALLAGDWRVGLLLGVAFGLARALPLLRMRTVTSPAALASLFQRLSAAEPRARQTLIATQGLVAMASLGMALAISS